MIFYLQESRPSVGDHIVLVSEQFFSNLLRTEK